MAYSNADQQQRYRQRLRAQGLVQVQGWVTPDQAEVIRRIMAKGSRRGVTPRAEQRAEPNHP
jgi:hypothetical protein